MHFLEFFISQVNTTRCYVLAILLAFSTLTVHAELVSGQFNVTVNLQSSSVGLQIAPISAFCRSPDTLGSFGATATVVCATGAVVDISPSRIKTPLSPVHGGAYRYIFQASRDGNILGTVDSYVEVGNETSWRVINLIDRVYLEMLVGW